MGGESFQSDFNSYLQHIYMGQMSGTKGVNAAVHLSVVMDSFVCTVMF